MSLAELLPSVEELPRTDKLRLLRYLAETLVQEEERLLPPAEYPVWSPHQATDAAATLLQVLRESEAKA